MCIKNEVCVAMPQQALNRTSGSQMFFKISFLKNFAWFTGNHPCWTPFLIKLQVRQPATLLKRSTNTHLSL